MVSGTVTPGDVPSPWFDLRRLSSGSVFWSVLLCVKEIKLTWHNHNRRVHLPILVPCAVDAWPQFLPDFCNVGKCIRQEVLRRKVRAEYQVNLRPILPRFKFISDTVHYRNSLRACQRFEGRSPWLCQRFEGRSLWLCQRCDGRSFWLCQRFEGRSFCLSVLMQSKQQGATHTGLLRSLDFPASETSRCCHGLSSV